MEGNTVHNIALNESYNLDDPNMDPLEIATLLVQVTSPIIRTESLNIPSQSLGMYD